MLSYLERKPRRALQPFVECLWGVSDHRVRTRRRRERIVPDGCPELIVHLADPFSRLVGRRFVRQPRAFLAGSLTRPWLLRPGRRVCTLGIRFRPGALTSFFPINMEDTTDRELRLAELAGREAARDLLRATTRARTLEARFGVAEEWLLRRVGAEPRPSPVVPAVRLILQARGQVRLDALARALGWSPRRVERAFARDLGLRPKLFARIVRLNAVLARLDDRQRAAAVDLALETGYFDQSHLLRDFRALAGRTPRGGRGADGDLARNFTHPERLRLLFSGE